MMNSSCMSPADMAAIMGNGNNGFGNANGGWWLIVLFVLLFGGWNNGWGGYAGSGGNGQIGDNYVLASDFATIQRQLSDGFASMERKGDTINNGLCDGFYAQNTTMLNGFNGVNMNIANGFANAELARANAQANTIAAINGVSNQLAQCCCDNKSAIADVKYAMAMDTNNITQTINQGLCQTNYNNATNTRDIIDSQNAGTREIMNALNAMKMEQKDARIAEQNQMIFNLQLAASQAAQNDYLINRLNPTPVPCFPAANLYGYMNCNQQCRQCC